MFIFSFKITYKDPSFEHVDTDKIENWSQAVVLKAPKSNYEIIQLTPNSFYEIDVVARNDIGPSASQPFRIRTLAASQGKLIVYLFYFLFHFFVAKIFEAKEHNCCLNRSVLHEFSIF